MTDVFDDGGYRFEDLKSARIVSNRTDFPGSSASLDFLCR